MASNKRFLRNYKLTLVTPNREIVVKPPIRIAFDVNKSTSGGLNSLSLDIYNLSPENRDALTKNKEDDTLILVNLEIGYGEGSDARLESIFKGKVFFSRIQGPLPDIIVSLEGFDGEDARRLGYVNETIGTGGNPVTTLVDTLSQYDVTIGNIAKDINLTRPKVLIGNTIDQIKKYIKPDEFFFIDNQQVYIGKIGESVYRVVPVVNSSTGLISTPTIESQRVTFETLLNPAIKVGGLVQIESKFEPRLDGRYIVATINYSGDYWGDEWNQICVCDIPRGNTE